ncbi:hypothetical protein [uncultured Eubacterium sp.]|uniref:hypothetical protein n=1 Tax=uncultured Eubacterium sp. TaxID=165185 RepID=UPI0026375CDC|nr:hypothetical protein [uncultured Eubacterium sp.]
MRSLDYSFLESAKVMPPLRHKNKTGKFDVMESDVCEWLTHIPEVRQKIFDMAINKKYIKYNNHTQKWEGVNYGKRI